MVEQLFCKQQVASSIPATGFAIQQFSHLLRELKLDRKFAEVAERLMASDCKSDLERVRRFESVPLHFLAPRAKISDAKEVGKVANFAVMAQG